MDRVGLGEIEREIDAAARARFPGGAVRHVVLGRSGLETVDTLIMAGIADTRADAIRWALDRIRERPAYERLRERIQEIEQLRYGF